MSKQFFTSADHFCRCCGQERPATLINPTVPDLYVPCGHCNNVRSPLRFNHHPQFITFMEQVRTLHAETFYASCLSDADRVQRLRDWTRMTGCFLDVASQPR